MKLRVGKSPYPWMALAAFIVIAAGKALLPVSGQQAQNLSLAVEAMVGAALGLAAFRWFTR